MLVVKVIFVIAGKIFPCYSKGMERPKRERGRPPGKVLPETRSIRFSREDLDRLRVVATRKGISEAGVVRLALREFLRAQQCPACSDKRELYFYDSVRDIGEWRPCPYCAEKP